MFNPNKTELRKAFKVVISGGVTEGAAFVTDMDTQTLNWCNEHIHFLKWLMLAEGNMNYGRIVVYLRDGKFRAADICPRDRKEFE